MTTVNAYFDHTVNYLSKLIDVNDWNFTPVVSGGPIYSFYSGGSLGTIHVDLHKVAMAALSFLACTIIKGPTSLLFLGATFYLLYSSCTQHHPGVAGTLSSGFAVAGLHVNNISDKVGKAWLKLFN